MDIWSQREQASKVIEELEKIHSSIDNLWNVLCNELSAPAEEHLSSAQYSVAKSIDILKQIETELIKEIEEEEKNETVRV